MKVRLGERADLLVGVLDAGEDCAFIVPGAQTTTQVLGPDNAEEIPLDAPTDS